MNMVKSAIAPCKMWDNETIHLAEAQIISRAIYPLKKNQNHQLQGIDDG